MEAVREFFTCEVPRAWTARSYATMGERSYSPKSRYQKSRSRTRIVLCGGHCG